ncbi:hypothetical protein H4S06_000400 [Coemansia sp. BCRC 34490]|nr:hypothetical protein H4S06_000400 [Coemansia sp. BCRC 34490]
MGKRKSSRKVVKKERPKLETVFPCLFCNHEKTIQVSMDKENRVGNLRCKICGASYQAAIHHLSQPVDVYGEWIDACEEAKEREMDGLRHDEGADDRRHPARHNGSRSPADAAAGESGDSEGEGGGGGNGRAAAGDVDEYGIPSRLSDESDIDDF